MALRCGRYDGNSACGYLAGVLHRSRHTPRTRLCPDSEDLMPANKLETLRPPRSIPHEPTTQNHECLCGSENAFPSVWTAYVCGMCERTWRLVRSEFGAFWRVQMAEER